MRLSHGTEYPLVGYPVTSQRSFLDQLIHELDSYVIDELTRELGFGRTTWKLHQAGIQLVGHLTCMRAEELVMMKGIGPKTVQKIQTSLLSRGLTLGMNNFFWKQHRQYLAQHVFH